ncbi:uncharacterized protein LOC101708454 isoform X3 [Heterocephalus glaber]|uniref:Uncharacterized protein LOC101708454 isoform X3 n=1 Tax=Heterocephalus glaber TaxID=10181 RepID=A0AAX6SHL4_HETGA|nr:uncharacterized protein LOC101708454 isoform X3 [Heterocephalus glaber]
MELRRWCTACHRHGWGPGCPGRPCTQLCTWEPLSSLWWGWLLSSGTTAMPGSPTYTRCTAGWASPPQSCSPASLLKPLHVFFGAAILSLSMASVISGINEKLFFSLPCCVTGNDVRRSSQKSPLCPAPLRSTVHLRLPGVGVSLPWGWPSLQPAAVSTSLGIGRDFSGLHLCRSLLPWPLLLAAYCSPCRSGDPQEVSLGSGRVQPVWKPGRGCSPGAVTQLLALRVASRHCV